MSQTVKAGKRKEHVAVCVVELKASSDGGAEDAFLLVQRPAQGLLAGDSNLTVTDLIPKPGVCAAILSLPGRY